MGMRSTPRRVFLLARMSREAPYTPRPSKPHSHLWNVVAVVGLVLLAQALLDLGAYTRFLLSW